MSVDKYPAYDWQQERNGTRWVKSRGDGAYAKVYRVSARKYVYGIEPWDEFSTDWLGTCRTLEAAKIAADGLLALEERAG